MKIETPRQPRDDHWWELVIFRLFCFDIAYYFSIDLTVF